MNSSQQSLVLVVLTTFAFCMPLIESRRHRHGLASDEVNSITSRAQAPSGATTEYCGVGEACLYGVLKYAPRTAVKHVYKVIPTRCRCRTTDVCYFTQMDAELRADIYKCHPDTPEQQLASNVREQQSILWQYVHNKRR